MDMFDFPNKHPSLTKCCHSRICSANLENEEHMQSADNVMSTECRLHDWTSECVFLSRVVSKLNISSRQSAWLLQELKVQFPSRQWPSSMDTVRRLEEEAINGDNVDMMSTLGFTEVQFDDYTEGLVRPVNVRTQQYTVLWPPRKDHYSLLTRDILACAEEVLNCENNWEHAKFQADSASDEEPVFGELYQSDWWRSCGDGNILALVVYSDGTTISFGGKELHPVYMTLGNFPRSIRNRQQSKALVGFLPKVVATASTTGVRAYRRQVCAFL